MLLLHQIIKFRESPYRRCTATTEVKKFALKYVKFMSVGKVAMIRGSELVGFPL